MLSRERAATWVGAIVPSAKVKAKVAALAAR